MIKFFLITIVLGLTFSCSSDKGSEQVFSTKVNAEKISTIVAQDGTKLDIFKDDFGKSIVLDIKGVKKTFRFIPAGEFMMGFNNRDSNEQPVHKVKLSSFFIADSEITQELWKVIMLTNPSKFKGKTHPVEFVSWDECQKFIKELNLLSPALKFSLPTEAQWEYAARAGSKEDMFAGKLDDYAWYDKNSGKKTHPVKQKLPNAWGLYDVLGNVWEWCSDWYSSKYYSSSVLENPQGPSKGISRVFRGGSWNAKESLTNFGFRYGFPTKLRFNDRGFRLVVEIKKGSSTN